ncbi:cytochrome P450 6k1-like, partial [Hetaerina americana]|uniref:cytochrome P450 6k1-like n=1 Tax=Hetaerina americana TaxID=62018 RepID=UPI003A7F3A3F
LVSSRLLLAIWYFSPWQLGYWNRRGIPHVTAWPIFGSVSEAAFVRKPIGQVYSDIYKKGEGKRYIGFYKFSQPAVILRDPELIKKVIVMDFDHFPSNEVHGDVNLDPMFGRHLFALSGVRWSRLRRFLALGFTAGKLQEVSQLFPEVCNILKAHVLLRMTEAGGPWKVELRELFGNFTTSAMSSCALGTPCDAMNHPDVELRRMVRLLLEPSLKKVLSQLIFLQIPWLAKLLGIPFVPREVTEYFRKTVKAEVNRRGRTGIQRNDFMQMFIKLWHEGNLRSDFTNEGGLNGDQVVPQKVFDVAFQGNEMDDITAAALSFVSDGTVTTASLLSFTFFELAHSPDVQENVRKEVEEVLKRYKGVPTYEALQEMTYLEMVLYEVLRLYPPVPYMTRSCAKKYKLPNPNESSKIEGGFVLDKGMPVIVPTRAIQMDDAYFPNGEEFNPNRFSKAAISERKHYTYYPYGGGPRVCIGIKFGLLLAKAAIASLIPITKLLPHEDTARPITMDPHYFITVSKGGLWIKMQDKM